MSVGSVNNDEGAIRIDVNRSTVIVNIAVGLDYELANLQVDVAAEIVETGLLVLVEQVHLEFVSALERPQHFYPVATLTNELVAAAQKDAAVKTRTPEHRMTLRFDEEIP